MGDLIHRLCLKQQMYVLAGICAFSHIFVIGLVWLNVDLRSGLPGVTVIAVLTLGVSIFLAHYLGALNGARAKLIVDAMNAMAQGDLSKRVDMDGEDEFAWLSREYTTARRGFADAVRAIMSSAVQLASAAEELSKITEQSSQGVEKQQREVQQVATAMEEMSATVQEVASNAANAATGAQEADEQSKNGYEVVNETIETIHSLADEVKQTSEVIERLKDDSISIGTVLDVIRDIAEQTNLLALNAAIEAARAGEQGRGFAVVADEVRTLASRTQQSTQEIHQMIERLQSGANNAVEAMEHGRNKAEVSVAQAAKAGEALEAITSVVDNIKSMNIQIASAAEEQSATTEEINRNIVNISDVADETAEGSKRTASSSDDLAQLAMELQQQVGRFQVNE